MFPIKNPYLFAALCKDHVVTVVICISSIRRNQDILTVFKLIPCPLSDAIAGIVRDRHRFERIRRVLDLFHIPVRRLFDFLRIVARIVSVSLLTVRCPFFPCGDVVEIFLQLGFQFFLRLRFEQFPRYGLWKKRVGNADDLFFRERLHPSTVSGILPVRPRDHVCMDRERHVVTKRDPVLVPPIRKGLHKRRCRRLTCIFGIRRGRFIGIAGIRRVGRICVQRNRIRNRLRRGVQLLLQYVVALVHDKFLLRRRLTGAEKQKRYKEYNNAFFHGITPFLGFCFQHTEGQWERHHQTVMKL